MAETDGSAGIRAHEDFHEVSHPGGYFSIDPFEALHSAGIVLAERTGAKIPIEEHGLVRNLSYHLLSSLIQPDDHVLVLGLAHEIREALRVEILQGESVLFKERDGFRAY